MNPDDAWTDLLLLSVRLACLSTLLDADIHRDAVERRLAPLLIPKPGWRWQKPSLLPPGPAVAARLKYVVGLGDWSAVRVPADTVWAPVDGVPLHWVVVPELPFAALVVVPLPPPTSAAPLRFVFAR